MANIPVRTLLMVGDKHQRIDTSRRGGRRAHFVTEAGFDATRLDADGDADEGPARSHFSAAQCSNGELHSTSFTVPESRPWYEWSTHAEPLVLDLCKRCGPEVSNSVKDCFAFALSFKSDTAVAAQTKLPMPLRFPRSYWNLRIKNENFTS